METTRSLPKNHPFLSSFDCDQLHSFRQGETSIGQMAPKTVLFFGCDSTWPNLRQQGFRRRNTHFLKALSELPEVSLVINIQFMSRVQFVQSLLKKQDTQGKGKDFNVTNYIPGKARIVKKINRNISRLRIQRIAHHKQHSKNIISWCYLPSGYRCFSNHFNNGLMLLDLDHNQVADVHYPSKEKIESIHISAKAANLTISSSRSMNHWIEKRNLGPTQLVMNGIVPLTSQHPESGKHRTLKIGYLGTLSHWIDYEAFELIISNCPNHQFHIAGSAYKSDLAQKLQRYDNVVMVGFLSPESAIDFLASMHVTLSLYLPLEGLDVNSMKIYESLRAHTPVAALGYHPDLAKDFDELINIYDSPQQLITSIRDLAKQAQDPIWKTAIDNFIQNSTWQQRAKAALTAMQNV